MGKTLVLAEKPSVARDIARVLGAKTAGDGFLSGGEWVVSWAIGHLVSLCDPDELNPAWKKWRPEALPMLPDALLTKVLPRTRTQFGVLKRLLNDQEISRVICATDSGREGELIFRYIYRQAGCSKPVERLWISSMTDEAIRAGFAKLKPSSEYDALYESARCRSEADWLVGMNATRAFTLKYGVLLSVGRVQTPTLRILVEREREIAAFVPRDYWEVTADFGDYKGAWFDPATDDTKIFDRDRATAIREGTVGREAKVSSVKRERKRTPPPQLYDLTALQRDANARMGLSAARTLDIAQSLYEKHKLITYPRTDSRYLPRDQQKPVEKVLFSLPEPYAAMVAPLSARPLYLGVRVYDDAKVSDHHAIIPTGKQPPAGLTGPERSLFDLVARRLIAVHYPDYEYESTRVVTRADQNHFRTTGVTVLREGWRALYRDKPDEDKESPLPPLSEGDTRMVRGASIKKLKTKPPERLNDGTLLRAMECAGRSLADEELRERMKAGGLGTPATRAATIERLIEVGYAKRSGKALEATEKGIRLIDVAPDEIASPETTGRWEKALYDIANSPDYPARSERFMAGIRRLSQFLVDTAKAAPEGTAFPAEAPKGRRHTEIAHCPICGEGKVFENERAFGCTRWKQGCAFTLWKDALTRQGGPALTAVMVKSLLAGREVSSPQGVVTYRDGRLTVTRAEAHKES